MSNQYFRIDIDKILKVWEKDGLEHMVEEFPYSDKLDELDDLDLLHILNFIQPSNIQEFIYLISHFKPLTNKQKKLIESLLARDVKIKYEAKHKNITGKHKDIDIAEEVKHRSGVSCDYVSPKELQKFLSDYNQDDILKYTCHPIDSEEIITDINNKCGTKEYSVEKHSELINKRFKEKFNNFSGSKNMSALIQAYLSGSKDKEWSSNKVKINWESPELIKWSKENPGKVASPGKNIAKGQKNNGFRLPEPFSSSINGSRVATFTGLVIYFKTLIHIRRDNSLKDNIEVANKKINGIEVSFSNFNEGIELFTDVDKLLQAYKKIIRICKEYSENKEISKFKISFYKDERSVYLCIHHTNTKYGKTLRDSLNRIGEGQADLIKNQINGLCDLYIEADFGDSDYARINLWDESDKLTSEKIPEMKGVKYILRF